MSNDTKEINKTIIYQFGCDYWPLTNISHFRCTNNSCNIYRIEHNVMGDGSIGYTRNDLLNQNCYKLDFGPKVEVVKMKAKDQ